jgi:hypothetical protein
MKTRSKTAKLFQPGEMVVIIGSTLFDRDMVMFNDPVSFVSSIANKEENSEPVTNQQFMMKVSRILKEVDVSIPHHNEEAFILALINAGICSTAILN